MKIKEERGKKEKRKKKKNKRLHALNMTAI
jgi:hypothetical protein